MTKEAAEKISDLHFTETYRVPFQFSRKVREALHRFGEQVQIGPAQHPVAADVRDQQMTGVRVEIGDLPE